MPRFGLNEVLAADCCVPDCEDTSHEDAPFPICSAHYADIIRHFRHTVRGNGYTSDLYGNWEIPMSLMADDAPSESTPTHVIYFIRFGTLVKVGITNSIVRRLTELPHDEVLGVIPGTHADEKDWHRRLREHRHSGEWFKLTPEVRQAIETRLAKQAA